MLLYIDGFSLYVIIRASKINSVANGEIKLELSAVFSYCWILKRVSICTCSGAQFHIWLTNPIRWYRLCIADIVPLAASVAAADGAVATHLFLYQFNDFQCLLVCTQQWQCENAFYRIRYYGSFGVSYVDIFNNIL